MMEKPILFSGDMVGAILDGRKTQTRRVIKPQPIREEPWWVIRSKKAMKLPGGNVASEVKSNDELYIRGVLGLLRCRYGQVGDRLWVRETCIRDSCGGLIGYKADGCYKSEEWEKVTTARFMPKILARIWLEITNVRVERVQDISGNDAIAEGIKLTEQEGDIPILWMAFAQTSFSALWDSLNAKRGYGWDKNPWVWVIEFKLIKIILSPLDTLLCIAKKDWDNNGIVVAKLRRDEIRDGLTTQSWNAVIEKVATQLEKQKLYEKVVLPFSTKKQMQLKF